MKRSLRVRWMITNSRLFILANVFVVLKSFLLKLFDDRWNCVILQAAQVLLLLSQWIHRRDLRNNEAWRLTLLAAACRTRQVGAFLLDVRWRQERFSAELYIIFVIIENHHWLTWPGIISVMVEEVCCLERFSTDGSSHAVLSLIRWQVNGRNVLQVQLWLSLLCAWLSRESRDQRLQKFVELFLTFHIMISFDNWRAHLELRWVVEGLENILH